MSDEGKIIYGLGADTQGLKRDLEKAKGMFSDLSDTTQKEGTKMDGMLKTIAASIGIAFSASQAASYAKQIALLRGELQQLEVAFTTMLGSKIASDKLMGELIVSAATTPFDLKGIANGAKSLLAYGTAADQVNNDLLMLGNVAAGLSIPLSDMVYLYGTTQVQGRLYAQDMRQFMGRGIPVAEELAKQFGVAKEKVNELVGAGKIGFPEIQKAFIAMTSEGGKFNGLMEAQSKTITGQLANLGDAIDMMMNEMGEAREGAISTAIEGASSLVDNYEKVGKTIAALIITFGAYKAALITMAAIEKANASITAMVAASNGVFNRTLAARWVLTEKVATAQLRLNKIMAANKYVLLATLVVGVAAAMWALRDSTTAAERAQKRYNDEKEKESEASKKRQAEVEGLIETSRNQALADTTRAGALKDLLKIYPDILSKYNLEKLSLEEILAIKKEIAEFEAGKAKQSNIDKYNDQQKLIDELDYKIKNFKGVGGTNDFATLREYKLLQRQMEIEKNVLKSYREDIQKDEIAAWTASISEMTTAQIQAEMKARERALYALKGKKETTVASVGALGHFDMSEIKAQTAALDVEMNKRKHAAIRDKSYWELQKKNAEEALAAMTDAMKGTKEWNDEVAKIKKADAKLKIWSVNDKEINNALKDQKRRNKEILKEELIQKRREEDLQLEKDESTFNSQLKGAEKELAMAKLLSEKKTKQYERNQEDELEALRDLEEKKHEASKKKGEFKRESIQLPEETSQTYKALIDAEKAALGVKNKEIIDAALVDYATFKQKVDKINEGYDNAESLIQKLMKMDGADQNALNEKIGQIKTNREKDIKTLTNTLLQEAGLLELYQGKGADFIKDKITKTLPLFEDITKLTKSELKKLSSFISEIEFTPEQLQTIKDAGVSLDELQEALKYFKEKAKEAVDLQKWKDLVKIAQKLASSIGSLGASLEKTKGLVGQIGAGLSQASAGIGNIVAMFDKEATTLDYVSGAIEGIAQLYGMIADQINKNKQAQEEWNAKIVESAHKAALARIEMEAYKSGNIFGIENPYAKAISGAMEYAQAMSELRDMTASLEEGQVQTGSKKVVSGSNIGTGLAAGAGAGAGVGAIIGSFIPVVGTAIGAAVGAGIGALIGGITGALTRETVPIFNSLKKQYGEIYNSETFELNPDILRDYDKLDEATKKLVDNWGEIKEKAEEAEEQMRQTFKELAGDMGTNLSDALVDAFTNGEVNGAIDSFKKNVTKTIEGIIQQLIFAHYFKGLLDNLEEEMTASFGENGDGTIVDDIMRFMDEYPSAIAGYNEMMTETQEEMKKRGWDLFTSSREGSSKGIATASQDSVNELNGRFTAVQGHTYSISENMKVLITNGAGMLTHLFNIDESTKRLKEIENHMKSVKTGIAQINDRGVTIKP